MSKYIDADLYVEMQIYDDEHEEWGEWKGTIEELLDQWTEQGCPSPIEVREGRWERHPISENRAWDVCTACGTGCRRRHYGFNDDGTEWVAQANYPFCPNCGAKMKR